MNKTDFKIIKEIPKEEYNIAINIYNECFNKNTTNIATPLLGNLLGLYLDNTLIGIAQIDYFNNIMDNQKQAIINNFCIKKEYQHQGYGNYLLNECIKYLKNKGINKINMTSNKNRIYAHMLYQKNNFEIIDTILLNKNI